MSGAPHDSQGIQALGFKLLHVGVAVPSLGPTTETLSKLFGYRVISGPFDDPIQKVTVNFLTTAPTDDRRDRADRPAHRRLTHPLHARKEQRRGLPPLLRNQPTSTRPSSTPSTTAA